MIDIKNDGTPHQLGPPLTFWNYYSADPLSRFCVTPKKYAYSTQ